MAVIPKEPLDWLPYFRQQINEIVSYLSALEINEQGQEFAPPIDIFETADAFVVEIETPGLSRGDFSLNICCNVLIVQGSKREESYPDGINYLCLERHFGRFFRTVEIPPDVDLDAVAARYKAGVLEVVFPRVKGKRMFIREIPIE